jgi:Na+/melibiose symporter-like transporter
MGQGRKSSIIEKIIAHTSMVPELTAKAIDEKERLSTVSTAVMSGEDGRLPLSIKLIYGSPRFTIRAAFIIIGIYANLYYINLGASINKMAFYIAAGRSFDVMTDPFMGWISDSTRSRWGRRKPYLLPGTILYSFVYVLFWSPWIQHVGSRDGGSCEGGDINEWFGITYILFFCMDTFTSVPYYALGAELTDSAEERNSVYFWQNLFGQLGTLIGMAAPAMMLNIMGSEESSYTATALCFAAVHVAGIALILKYIEERPLPTVAVAPFAVNFVRVLSNKAFQPLLASWFFDWGSLGLLSAMFPLFIQYIIIAPSDPPNYEESAKATLYLAYCSIALFVAAILSMPVWLKIGQVVGKRKAWLAYNIWNSITCPWFLLLGRDDAGSMPMMCILISVLNGTAVGGQFFVDSVTADVIDYDEFLYGNRIEGAFSTLNTFIPKIILVATTALPLAFISYAGFGESIGPDKYLEINPGINETIARALYGETCIDSTTCLAACPKAPVGQPEEVKLLIRWLFAGVPTMLTIISCVIKLYYPIRSPAIMHGIQEGIKKQRTGKAAEDPVNGNMVRRMKFNAQDIRQQKWVWALQHFSKHTVRCYKERCDGADGAAGAQWWLVFHMAVQSVVGILILVASLIAVIVSVSHGYLEVNEKSWIPTASCVIFGGSFTFFAFALMRLAVARRMNRTHDAAPNADRLTDRFLNRICSQDEQETGIELWGDDEHDMGTEMNTTSKQRQSLQDARVANTGEEVANPVSPTQSHRLSDGAMSGHKPNEI